MSKTRESMGMLGVAQAENKSQEGGKGMLCDMAWLCQIYESKFQRV